MLHHRTGHFAAGAEATVKWGLDLALLPGYYFFSCGCSYPHADRFLCRQVDALKLVVTGEQSTVGFVNMVRQFSVAADHPTPEARP
jgi:hypothetical protein